MIKRIVLLFSLCLLFVVAIPVGAANDCRINFGSGNLCLPAGNFHTNNTPGYLLDVDELAYTYSDHSAETTKINISVKRSVANSTSYDAIQAFSDAHQARTDRIYNDSPILTENKVTDGTNDPLSVMFYNSTLPDGSGFHAGAVSVVTVCRNAYTIETFAYGDMSDNLINQIVYLYEHLSFYVNC